MASDAAVAALSLPDLDSRAAVELFVDSFYERMLADPALAPIFLDVAGVDLAVHLPHIKDYWSKLLLGERKYQRHTMNIHRAVHTKQALQPEDFQRWLAHFIGAVNEQFSGAGAERAKRIATTIAANMEKALH